GRVPLADEHALIEGADPLFQGQQLGDRVGAGGDVTLHGPRAGDQRDAPREEADGQQQRRGEPERGSGKARHGRKVSDGGLGASGAWVVVLLAGCGAGGPSSPSATEEVAAASSSEEMVKVGPADPPPADIGTRKGGEDWPRFLGPRGDSTSAEKGIVAPWPKN